MSDKKIIILAVLGIAAFMFTSKARAATAKPSSNAIPYNPNNPYNNPYLPGYTAPDATAQKVNAFTGLLSGIAGIFSGSGNTGANTNSYLPGAGVGSGASIDGNQGEAAAAAYFAQFPDQFAVNPPVITNTNPAAYTTTGGFLDGQ